jgi:hypothetical protein
LLGPRDERASGNSAAKRDNNFSPPDLDCHATLPRGSCNGRDHITTERAALRDFKPAYLGSGSNHDLAFRALVCQLPPAADMPSH